MRAVVTDGKGMKDWIKTVQSWIEIENRATKELEDSGYSEQAPVWDSSLYVFFPSIFTALLKTHYSIQQGKRSLLAFPKS